MKVIGENAVLEWTEERRLSSHEEQHSQHQIRVVRQEPSDSQTHDQNLGQLDQPDQARFLELVGELTSGCGENKKWQNERPRGDVYKNRPIETGRFGQPI